MCQVNAHKFGMCLPIYDVNRRGARVVKAINLALYTSMSSLIELSF